jgi:hypothetical protein
VSHHSYPHITKSDIGAVGHMERLLRQENNTLSFAVIMPGMLFIFLSFFLSFFLSPIHFICCSPRPKVCTSKRHNYYF